MIKKEGGQHMDVIVHYPQSTESISALRKRVAVIHAQTVVGYIHKLPCPKEQKLRLLKEIEQARPG